MQFRNRKILITGGNSGIGRALAERLAAQGNQLILTGRNPDTLAETLAANPGMAGYPLDVTDPAAIADFARQLLWDHADLDAVILNAGIMEREDFTADPIDLSVATRTIQTNLIAPMQLAAALLPHLRTRPEAALITVSSGLAFVPRADSPSYSATKAAIHSWTQSLRHQLRDTSVTVLEIAPPLVATELTPGQSQLSVALPLDDFISEVVGKLDDTTDEVLVQRVLFQRNAEAESRFDDAFAAINPS